MACNHGVGTGGHCTLPRDAAGPLLRALDSTSLVGELGHDHHHGRTQQLKTEWMNKFVSHSVERATVENEQSKEHDLVIIYGQLLILAQQHTPYPKPCLIFNGDQNSSEVEQSS